MPIYLVLLTAGSVAYLIMRYIYYKNPELFICLVVLINFDFFYLLPPVGGFYNYGITLLPVFALLLIEQVLKGEIRSGIFGVLILIYTFLLFIGIVTAFNNGQPIGLGVKDIKYQLLIYVYFVVASRDIKLEKFVRYFMFFTVVFMLLADIDTAFFKGQLIFARASERFMGERLDRTRFNLGAAMISVACIMAFASFLKTKSKTYGALFFIFFLHIFFVIQTRMIIAGIIITSALLVATVRKLSISGTFLMIFLVSLSIPGVMLFGNFFNEIGLVKETRSDIQNKTGSWEGRKNSYKYYWGKIADSPLFGYGYENLNWERSPEPRLRSKGIFKEDIGLSHFFYENGVLGFLWFLGLTVSLILKIWPIKRDIPEIIAYFIFAYAVIITLDYFLYRYTILLFGIFLGLLARHTKIMKQNKRAQLA